MMSKQKFMDLDAIVVSVSGGGMASGVAVAAKHLKPAIKGEKTAIEIIREITNTIKKYQYKYYDTIHKLISTTQKFPL